jgi:hypothetical protein
MGPSKSYYKTFIGFYPPFSIQAETYFVSLNTEPGTKDMVLGEEETMPDTVHACSRMAK